MGQFSDRFLPRKPSKKELRARRIALEIIREAQNCEIGSNDFERLRYYIRNNKNKYLHRDQGSWAIRYIEGIIDKYDKDRNKKGIV